MVVLNTETAFPFFLSRSQERHMSTSVLIPPVPTSVGQKKVGSQSYYMTAEPLSWKMGLNGLVLASLKKWWWEGEWKVSLNNFWCGGDELAAITLWLAIKESTEDVWWISSSPHSPLYPFLPWNRERKREREKERGKYLCFQEVVAAIAWGM